MRAARLTIRRVRRLFGGRDEKIILVLNPLLPHPSSLILHPSYLPIPPRHDVVGVMFYTICIFL